VVGALIPLAAVTYAAWQLRRGAPYVLVGWLWFVGMLVPVIGIVQVGDQSIADRYTYLPSIGLMFAIVWAMADFLRADPVRDRAGITIAITAILVVLVIATSLQLRHWAGGTIPLFQHAIDVTDDNWVAHRHLASAYADAPNYDAAERHFRIALRLSPASAQTHFNYGNFFARQRRFMEAITQYREAVKLDPNFAVAHNSLGAALATDGDFAGAESAFRDAVRASPTYAEAHANLGKLLAKQGRHAEAVVEFNQALRLKPGFAMAQQGLAASQAALSGNGGR
jgi:Tfp pilus assembly protein PilF